MTGSALTRLLDAGGQVLLLQDGRGRYTAILLDGDGQRTLVPVLRRAGLMLHASDATPSIALHKLAIQVTGAEV